MKKYISFLFIMLLFLISNTNAKTSAPVDITTMSITDLSAALDKGYLTSETLVNLYLERIEAYNDKFNAINQINEHAVEQAKELDKERANGQKRSILHGIPILVKCNIDVYGMPTTAGTKSLSDNYPKENSFAVQKLIDAGAIILASTNMSELAFSARDSYSSYGYVHNVFNPDYTPYGSSGGSAVGVKASFGAAALGTDTNSSVRLPASGAGLVGIRPTFGLVSRTGVIPYDIYRDTIGVISNTVSDNALILSIISGPDSNDSVTKNTSKFSLNTKDFNLNGINIGVPREYLKGSGNGSGVTSKTDEDIYNIATKAIESLTKAGANIIYLDNFVKSSNITIASSTQSGITMCDGINSYLKGTTGTIRNFKELVYSNGHVQSLGGYLSGCGIGDKESENKSRKKAEYRKYVDDYFTNNNLDLIIYPSLKNKPGKYNDGVANISPGSSLGSVIGYPSITIPMGYDSSGFAYGLEFFSTANKEELLYNVGIEFEKANGNKVQSSPLTPPLYEVPNEVSELLTTYEKVLAKNSNNKKILNWVNDVQTYLKEYNNNDDVAKTAQELLETYQKTNLNNIFNFKRTIVYILFCLITLIIVIVFFNEFFEKS